MVSTFTTNKGYEKPARGDQVGTWDNAANPNYDLLDSNFGGIATIALTNSPVALSTAQRACAFLRFTGALTADVPITLPAVGSFYTIINDTTNSSNFVITALTTAGGRTIGLPPGTMTPIMTDGTNVRFTTLPAVGSYWDYAGSSTPRWVSACTIAPYLNCDGATFSSATYPALTAVLVGTTLPDLRGRVRATLNQGTGRITTAGGGVDGNTNLANGGVQAITITQANLPNVNFTVTDLGHSHTYGTAANKSANIGGGGAVTGWSGSANTTTSVDVTNITVNSGGSGTGSPVLPPMTIGGITLVRSA